MNNTCLYDILTVTGMEYALYGMPCCSLKCICRKWKTGPVRGCRYGYVISQPKWLIFFQSISKDNACTVIL